MKIVIAGAGEVGSHLAKLFSNEDQDITLLDNDSVRLGIMDSNYNLMTVEGDPTSFGALREANAGKCDLFIAVTPYQTNNIVACSIAKNLGARMTVARIDTYDYMQPDNLPYVHALGVDRVIYDRLENKLKIIRRIDPLDKTIGIKRTAEHCLKNEVASHSHKRQLVAASVT